VSEWMAIADRPAAADVAPAGPDAGPCRVELVERPGAAWDEYVLAHPEGSLFHSLAWRDAVADVFRHEPLYLRAHRVGRTVGVLPLFLVRSRLAGRLLVSVPYGVGGGIRADDEEAIGALFDAACRLTHERRCRHLDLRSERAALPELATSDRYVGFRRVLPQSADEVLGWLPRKARAASRNARHKYGLTVSFGDDQLGEVWWLYTASMRRLASLNYPLAFFERLLELTPGRHWVSVVRWEGRPVAGLVTFLFRDCVMPYFYGATDLARTCSAANLIYLTAMERGAEAGYRVFDFGRSRCDNAGSFDFKRFHGFEPRPLEYQSYTPPGSTPPDLAPSNPRYRLARWVWCRLPLFATRALGGALSRHIPG